MGNFYLSISTLQLPKQMYPDRRLSLKIVSFLAFALLSVLLFGCKGKKRITGIDPEFSKYIEFFTAGVISKKSTIKVQFASDVATTHTLHEPLAENLFQFSPSATGKAYWIDERTIEFKPDRDLQPDKLYEVKFELDKIKKVPEKFKDFTFNLQVIRPAFSVQDNGLRAENNSRDQMQLSGTVLTADVEENAKIENVLKASYPVSGIEIKWQHNEPGKTHDFVINHIKRGGKENNIMLRWDGNPIGSKQNDQKNTAIPAEGDFRVLGVRAIQDAEEYALVQFSDPVAFNQDLTGLIAVSEQEDVSFSINGSEVKVFASNQLDGNYSVNINEGILNNWGKRLPKSFVANTFFENRLPSVKIHGNGTILPDSGGNLVLPFDAVNLRAVDVSVIKIFENNVAQFLQSNDLNGTYELRQVARPLVKATVKLDSDASLNLHKKNRFSLDIDKYIRTERGAIYSITLGFRPAYSLYACNSLSKEQVTKGAEYAVSSEGDNFDENSQGSDEAEYYYEGADRSVDEDEDFWSRYDRYYPYGYKWNERDNPCSKSYYTKERFASRNILATNIALTAKKGTGNSILVAATDIITTRPLNKIKLEVLDYQKQVIAKGETDGTGIATLEMKKKALPVSCEKWRRKKLSQTRRWRSFAS